MIGEELRSENGNLITVIKELGSGGQGKVFLVKVNGEDMALKWYHKSICTTALKDRLIDIIDTNIASDIFLLPKELVLKGDRFGYIMPLLEKRFKSIPDLLARRVTPSFSTLIRTGYRLVTAFDMLHSKGKCYRDISNFNVLFDPDSGEIRIIDNDNIMTNNSEAGEIISTPGFAAPEVILGLETPSTDTDLFSLSVLLFYLFYNHHPLEGKQYSKIRCFDAAAKEKLYAIDPVYMFDPNNDTNRPVEGEHDNPVLFDKIYPKSFKKLFEQAFTMGLKEPRKRVREPMWQKEFLSLLDRHTICPHCENEGFIDWSEDVKCFHCKKPLQKIPKIQLEYSNQKKINEVISSPGTFLYTYHFDNTKDTKDKFSNLLFEVVKNPKNPKMLGLTNLTDNTIEVFSLSGKKIDVPSKKSFSIKNGLQFKIDNTTAKIIY